MTEKTITLTATVTDSAGGSTTATLTITRIEPPRWAEGLLVVCIGSAKRAEAIHGDLCEFVLAGTRSDRLCLVERSGFGVRCR
jgi:hypothetical protein